MSACAFVCMCARASGGVLLLGEEFRGVGLQEGRLWEGLWLIPWLSAHSHLPYDVTPEQALSHPEVQRRLDISLRSLLAMTDKFLVAIMSSVEQIPYVHPPRPSQAPGS